jgi:hypothetical protein
MCFLLFKGLPRLFLQPFGQNTLTRVTQLQARGLPSACTSSGVEDERDIDRHLLAAEQTASAERLSVLLR